jgi:hypothetical protein
MNFRTKLLGLAGTAMVFTGLAYGQNTACTLNPPAVGFLRAEGQTELLPPLVLSCTTPAGNAAASLSATFYLSPAVTVTSALIVGSSTNTEAVATGGANGVIVSGGVSFSGVVVPANAGAVPVVTLITFNNIRINATAVPIVVGAAPTAVNVSGFIAGTNVIPSAPASTALAYVTNGLQAAKFGSTFASPTDGKITNATGANNAANGTGSSFGVCGSQNSSGGGTAVPNFFINATEGFQTSFRTVADEASGIGADAASTATRIKLTFSNVPAGLNIYLPINVTSQVSSPGPVTAAIQAITSETGAAIAQTPVTSPAQFTLAAAAGKFVDYGSGSTGGVFGVPVSNGTGVAIYNVLVDNPNVVDNFLIPVYLSASSNAVAIQSTSLTVTESFAPIVAATTIPSFAVLTSSSPSLSVLSFTQCSTTLLFPFVTNAAGFETGIALDNTSKDPFGTKTQAGTCNLNFYGTGGTNPTAVVAPNTNEGAGQPYAAGEAYAFTLTQALAVNAANPATFQGYIIATCNFNYAHGFAYITYGFPGTSSDTMGYLAIVTNRGANGAQVDFNGF